MLVPAPTRRRQESVDQQVLDQAKVDGRGSHSSNSSGSLSVRPEVDNPENLSSRNIHGRLTPRIPVNEGESVSDAIVRICQDYLVHTNLPPPSNHTEMSDREIARVDWFDIPNLRAAERKATQGLPKHPFFLTVEWVVRAVMYRVSHWLYRGYYSERAKVLDYCHALECNRHMSPSTFHQLKENIHNQERFQALTVEYINDLKSRGFLDKKAHRHVTSLFLSRGDTEVWRYLNVVSSINSLTNNKEDVLKVVSSGELAQLIHQLKEISADSCTQEEKADKLTNILSRVRVMKWLENLAAEDPGEHIDIIMESIRDGDPDKFRTKAISMLRYVAQTKKGQAVAEAYCLEIARALETDKTRDPFALLSHAIASNAFVMSWNRRLHSLANLIEELEGKSEAEIQEVKENLKSVYTAFGTVLKDEKEFLCSDTQFSRIYGDFVKQWTVISDSLHKYSEGKTGAHEFCSCVNQSVERAKTVTPWPLTATTVIGGADRADANHSENPDRKRVMALTCSWGGGHRAAASAVENYCSQKGYHYTAVDGPQEIFISRDMLQNAIGGDYSVTMLYNTLVARQAWGVIRMLAKLSGHSDASQPADEVEVALARQRILMEKPDLIVATYAKHNKVYLKVAEELGIPIVHVKTDLDCTETQWDLPPAYDHFKVILPTNHPDVVKTLGEQYKEDQLAFLGYPLRKEFVRPLSEEERKEHFARVRESCGIPDGKKIISVMGGAISAETPWPDMIMKAMKDGSLDDSHHLVIVTGNNVPYRKQLEQYLLNHPELKGRVSVLKFINGEEVAGIMRMSKCVVTKPGGGTVAEALTVGARLCLDQTDNSFMEWERFNAKFVENANLGKSFTHKDQFMQILRSQLDDELPPGVPALKGSQEEAYVELFDEMIEKAKSDAGCIRKHKEFENYSWERDPLSGSLQKGFRMEASLTQLEMAFEKDFFKNSLKSTEEVARFDAIPRDVQEALASNLPIMVNPKTHRLEVTKDVSFANMKKILEYAVSYYSSTHRFGGDEGVLPQAKEGMNLFTYQYISFIQNVLKNPKAYNLKLTGSQVRTLEKLLVNLDRSRACMIVSQKESGLVYLKENMGLSHNEGSRAYLRNIDSLFLTEGARKEFQKWSQMQTSRARKGKKLPGVSDYLMSPLTAAVSFFLKPASYEFVTNLHIHKHMSAYNEPIEMDEATSDIVIRCKGEKKLVGPLTDKYTFFLNRIVAVESGRECFYTHATGLDFGSPDNWGDDETPIPVFKTKEDRKTKDFRMEICTVCAKETHAWIRLKKPTGEVYSIGKFWDKDVDLPGFSELVKTVPAMLRVDYHEFFGEEKDIKRTVVKLTEEQFEDAMQEIKKVQKQYKSDDGGFNLATSNCSGFVKRMAEVVGVKIQTKFNVFEYVAGSIFKLPSSFRKFLYRHNHTRNALNVIFYPISLLRNTLLYFLGGFRHIGPDGLKKDNVFRSFWDIFKPSAGMVEHPIQVRTWQEVYKEDQRAAQGAVAV